MTHRDELIYGMAFQIWGTALLRLMKKDRFNYFIIDNNIRPPGPGERFEEMIPEEIPKVYMEAAKQLYKTYEDAWGYPPIDIVYDAERSIGRTLPLIECGRDFAMYALSKAEGYGYLEGGFIGLPIPTSPRITMDVSFDGHEATYDINSRIPRTANPAGLSARGERMYGHIREGYGDDPRAAEIAARTVIARSREIPGLMRNPPRLREGEKEFNATAGEIVDFGRPQGQRTRGRVMSVADKTVLVESLEERGKKKVHPSGRRYRVPRTDFFLKRSGEFLASSPVVPPKPTTTPISGALEPTSGRPSRKKGR